MSRKAHRLPNDTLHRMCKRVSFGVYTKLKAHNEVYSTADTIKWRLIDYNYQLEGEWSAAREKADWPDINLPGLKYKALKWLMRTLARIGHYPNAELLFMVGELEYSLSQGAFDWVLDLAGEAISLAERTEQYNHLRIILDLERRAVQRLYQGQQRVDAIRESYRTNARAEACLAEIADMEQLRFQAIEAIQKKREHGAEAFAALREKVRDYSSYPFKTVTAKSEFLITATLVLHETGEVAGGLAIGYKGLDLFASNPFLKSRDIASFFRHLLTVVRLEGGFGDLRAAMDTLHLHEQIKEDDIETVRAQMVCSTFARLILGLTHNRLDLIAEGLVYVEKNGAHLLNATQGPEKSWLYFLAIRSYIVFKKYLDAKLLIEQSWESKPRLNNNFVCHFRVLYILSIIKTEADQEFIFSALKSASTFVRRVGGKDSYLLLILGSLESLLRQEISQGLNPENIAKQVIRIERKRNSDINISEETFFPYLTWIKQHFSFQDSEVHTGTHF